MEFTMNCLHIFLRLFTNQQPHFVRHVRLMGRHSA